MRICFVSRGRLNAFANEYAYRQDDLIVFGFESIGEVSYEKELKGESDFFEETAKLSRKSKSVVVCGCVTDTRGHKRKSAVVAENGKLAGVSDMLNVVDGEVSCGGALRVYETRLGKMGVVVAEDIHFPDVVKALSLCGSDFIVCPFGRVVGSIQQVLLRSYAYCYGIPIFFCADGYCMIADASGLLSFASPYSPVTTDFENVREYHLIETRRRGFYRADE